MQLGVPTTMGAALAPLTKVLKNIEKVQKNLERLKESNNFTINKLTAENQIIYTDVALGKSVAGKISELLS